MSSQYYFNNNESRSYYQIPQQYQTTTANFNRNYSPTTPQVRACVRVLGSQDQYQLPTSPRLVQISPQQHHYQFDTHQQAGRPTGPPVVYQTPGASQFTHRNIDLWTEGPSSPRQDHYVQAQRVSVRSISTGSSPQRHNQQHQKTSFEQRPITNQQLSPSTVAYDSGQGQTYASQQLEQSSHPVGIRNLMSKFDAPKTRQAARSRSTSSRHNSSSNQNYTNHSITYSALPKSHEPPVNSLEYYQILQQNGIPFNNIQQAIAPAHIQHHPTGFGSLRDRFKTGSLSEDFNRSTTQHHNNTGNSLSSIRKQYINQTREEEVVVSQNQPAIPRTIIGEDYPSEKPTQEQGVSSF